MCGMAEWRNGRMVEWQNDGMTGEMAGWCNLTCYFYVCPRRNGGMATYQIDDTNIFKSCIVLKFELFSIPHRRNIFIHNTSLVVL